MSKAKKVASKKAVKKQPELKLRVHAKKHVAKALSPLRVAKKRVARKITSRTRKRTDHFDLQSFRLPASARMLIKDIHDSSWKPFFWIAPVALFFSACRFCARL